MAEIGLCVCVFAIAGMVFVVCMVAVYLILLVDALAFVGDLCAVDVVDDESETTPVASVGELVMLGATAVVV